MFVFVIKSIRYIYFVMPISLLSIPPLWLVKYFNNRFVNKIF